MDLFFIDIIALPLLYIPIILLLMTAFSFQLYSKSQKRRDLYLSIALFVSAILGFIPYKWANSAEDLLFWDTPFHWATIATLLATGFSLIYSNALTKKQQVAYIGLLVISLLSLPAYAVISGSLVAIALFAFGCFLLIEVRDGYSNESVLAYSFMILGISSFVGQWFPLNGGRFLYGVFLLLLLGFETVRFFTKIVLMLQSASLNSLTDTLTGLYNKDFLMNKADQLIGEEEISIIFADIDDFKKLNDTKGHAEGDLVLQQVGTIFSDILSMKGYACRYGGEEMVGIVYNGDAKRLAIEFCEKVAKRTSVTVSVGVATGNEDSQSLIIKADERMYKAKKSGKNQVIFD